CALIALIANCKASLLPRLFIPEWGPAHSHDRLSQRYAAGLRSLTRNCQDQAGTGERGTSGWFCGQSRVRLGGGLMIVQLANDMVRAHRNSPSPWLSANWPLAT